MSDRAARLWPRPKRFSLEAGSPTSRWSMQNACSWQGRVVLTQDRMVEREHQRFRRSGTPSSIHDSAKALTGCADD
jgi:hypothetical protein